MKPCLDDPEVITQGMSKSSKIFQIGRVLRGHTYGNIIRFCKQTGLTQLKNQKIRGKKSDKEISIHGVVLIEIRSNCYLKNEKKRHHLSQQQCQSCIYFLCLTT